MIKVRKIDKIVLIIMIFGLLWLAIMQHGAAIYCLGSINGEIVNDANNIIFFDLMIKKNPEIIKNGAIKSEIKRLIQSYEQSKKFYKKNNNILISFYVKSEEEAIANCEKVKKELEEKLKIAISEYKNMPSKK